MRILSVDDQAENRYLLEALLRGKGHEVRSVTNGAEALAELQASAFDLIISDILMPVMDGFALCRKVKADERLHHIPFICYTATYTGPQDEALAIKIGADRFIVKPCEPEVFMAAVDELLTTVGTKELPPSADLPLEEEVFKMYNERLVRKLEQKMQQLKTETCSLRETQAALRQSERKYRRLHQSMIDGFVYADMQGRICETNESFRGMLGYTETELSCLTYIDLTPSKWHVYEEELLTRKVLCNGYSPVYEKEYMKKDGSILPVELRTYLDRIDDGAPEGMWAIVRDLTERKRTETTHRDLENQLNHAQKMESVGRLAGGVAHDYNNMLSVILGYTQLAMAKIDTSSPLYGDLWEILDATKRSANITRQLLAFARKQTIALEVLDLNATVEGMLNMLGSLIGEDINLSLLPEENLWSIEIDPSQIDQLLANLCVNARDAISGVGRLTIETSNLTLDETYCAFHADNQPGSYVVLSVSDNGCGMTKEIQDKIFEPFFTTKDLGKGTGLGLATVYGIVKQNKGFINVYSEPGQGTTFKIYLPRHVGAVAAKAEEKKNTAPGQGETILIVEDEAAILRLTSRILVNAGYTVLTANSPAKAIDLAGMHKNDLQLIIVDVIMPEMNGRDLALLLQTENPDLQCLFMSGYTTNIVSGQGILEQEINFIQKPFSAESLVGKVGQLLPERQ